MLFQLQLEVQYVIVSLSSLIQLLDEHVHLPTCLLQVALQCFSVYFETLL